MEPLCIEQQGMQGNVATCCSLPFPGEFGNVRMRPAGMIGEVYRKAGRRSGVGAAWLIGLCLAGLARSAFCGEWASEVRSFVEKHCYECHDADSAKGDL